RALQERNDHSGGIHCRLSAGGCLPNGAHFIRSREAPGEGAEHRFGERRGRQRGCPGVHSGWDRTRSNRSGASGPARQVEPAAPRDAGRAGRSQSTSRLAGSGGAGGTDGKRSCRWRVNERERGVVSVAVEAARTSGNRFPARPWTDVARPSSELRPRSGTKEGEAGVHLLAVAWPAVATALAPP